MRTNADLKHNGEILQNRDLLGSFALNKDAALKNMTQRKWAAVFAHPEKYAYKKDRNVRAKTKTKWGGDRKVT